MSDLYLLNLQFLPATASDYDEVMSISGGIHDGVDYLPFRYHEWLAEPQRRMFAARSEEKVVAFASFLLVDGGVTAVLQGLRVAPWMRGRGIAREIQKFCFNTLRTNHPGVTKIRETVEENVPPSLLSKSRLLHSKAVVSVFLPNDHLEKTTQLLSCRLLSVYQGRPPVPQSLSKVLRLLDDPRTAEDLFPKGVLIQDLLPLTTHKCNIELLARWGIAWVYSKPSDLLTNPIEGANSSSISNLSEHSTLSCTSSGFLSLSTPPFPVPLEKGVYRLNIDLFGSNPSFAQAHILHHVTEAVRVLPPGGSIVCFVFAEETLRKPVMHYLHGMAPFPAYRELLMLERTLEA
uniref:N-acetyltransferase domain-containing protein n=1 Tax=Xenopus tropicalis TaxID=8364 RepID=A0A7D9NLM0_XENTR|eukprot:XP_002943238.2 PREDICTED: probable N-acetyltransferase 16 [Xenopus tropicalis]